jgi:hypothetical protein
MFSFTFVFKFSENGRHVIDWGIVESTPALPFVINYKVDMASFVDSRKVVARKNAFKAFPSARNGDKNRKLKKP